MPYDSDTASPQKPAGAKPAGDFVRQATASPFAVADHLVSVPSPPFFLMHYPQNWEVGTEGLEAPTWLPGLQRDFVEPGCNTIRTRKTGEPLSAMFDLAHTLRQRNGATILPQVLKLDGVGYDTYLQEMPVVHPRTGAEGTLYFDRWETPIPPKEPGKRVKFQRDRAEYNRWRLALVEQGVIAPPDPRDIDARVARAEYHVSRNALKTGVPEDERKRMVEEATAKAAVVAEAVIPEEIPVVRERPAKAKRGAKEQA